MTSMMFRSTGISQSTAPPVFSLTTSAGTVPTLVTPVFQWWAWIRSSGMEPNIQRFSSGVCGTCWPSVGITCTSAPSASRSRYRCSVIQPAPSAPG